MLIAMQMPGYGAIYQRSSARVCGTGSFSLSAQFACTMCTFDCELTLLALVSEIKEYAPIYLL